MGIRKVVLLLASMAAALLLASGVGLLNAVKPTQATFPGVNGKIAFTSYRDGDGEIYTINPDGGTPVQVTNNDTDDESPNYSPDGKRIVYSGFDGTDYEIYKISPTGGMPVNITNNDTHDYEPSWGSRP